MFLFYFIFIQILFFNPIQASGPQDLNNKNLSTLSESFKTFRSSSKENFSLDLLKKTILYKASKSEALDKNKKSKVKTIQKNLSTQAYSISIQDQKWKKKDIILLFKDLDFKKQIIDILKKKHKIKGNLSIEIIQIQEGLFEILFYKKSPFRQDIIKPKTLSQDLINQIKVILKGDPQKELINNDLKDWIQDQISSKNLLFNKGIALSFDDSRFNKGGAFANLSQESIENIINAQPDLKNHLIQKANESLIQNNLSPLNDSSQVFLSHLKDGKLSIYIFNSIDENAFILSMLSQDPDQAQAIENDLKDSIQDQISSKNLLFDKGIALSFAFDAPDFFNLSQESIENIINAQPDLKNHLIQKANESLIQNNLSPLNDSSQVFLSLLKDGKLSIYIFNSIDENAFILSMLSQDPDQAQAIENDLKDSIQDQISSKNLLFDKGIALSFAFDAPDFFNLSQESIENIINAQPDLKNHLIQKANESLIQNNLSPLNDSSQVFLSPLKDGKLSIYIFNSIDGEELILSILEKDLDDYEAIEGDPINWIQNHRIPQKDQFFYKGIALTFKDKRFQYNGAFANLSVKAIDQIINNSSSFKNKVLSRIHQADQKNPIFDDLIENPSLDHLKFSCNIEDSDIIIYVYNLLEDEQEFLESLIKKAFDFDYIDEDKKKQLEKQLKNLFIDEGISIILDDERVLDGGYLCDFLRKIDLNTLFHRSSFLKDFLKVQFDLDDLSQFHFIVDIQDDQTFIYGYKLLEKDSLLRSIIQDENKEKSGFLFLPDKSWLEENKSLSRYQYMNAVFFSYTDYRFEQKDSNSVFSLSDIENIILNDSSFQNAFLRKANEFLGSKKLSSHKLRFFSRFEKNFAGDDTLKIYILNEK